MRVLQNPINPGNSRTLSTLDQENKAEAKAINNAGLVVGSGQKTTSAMNCKGAYGGAACHVDVAFIFDPNTGFTTIGPPDMASVALAVNNRGQVVGTLGDRVHEYGFLYTVGQMYRIEGQLIPSGLGNGGWTNMRPTGINDNGQIVGIGDHPNGHTHVFLMTPRNAATVVNAPTTPEEMQVITTWAKRSPAFFGSAISGSFKREDPDYSSGQWLVSSMQFNLVNGGWTTIQLWTRRSDGKRSIQYYELNTKTWKPFSL